MHEAGESQLAVNPRIVSACVDKYPSDRQQYMSIISVLLKLWVISMQRLVL